MDSGKCFVCGESDNLVKCSKAKCPKLYHLKCIEGNKLFAYVTYRILGDIMQVLDDVDHVKTREDGWHEVDILKVREQVQNEGIHCT